MKQIKKSALALLLAGAMTVGMTGCSDTSWGAECEGMKMPAGVYISNVMSAYNDGTAMLSADADYENIWNNSVDGADLQSWVRNKSAEYVRTYFAVEKKFNEMGLVFDEAVKSQADQMANYQWSYYSSMYEENGISKASYTESIYNSYKASMLFEAYYAEGGIEEVSDQELLEYFNAHYLSMDRIVFEPETADDGTVSEDAIKKAMKEAEEYKAILEKGESIADLAKKYADEQAAAAGEEASDEEIDTGSVISLDSTAYDEEFMTALTSAAKGEPIVLEDGSHVYLIVVDEVTVEDEVYLMNESYLLSELKSDEFDARLTEWGKELNVTFNEAAVTRYDAKKLKF